MMEIIPRDTSKPSEDKIIEEVERLPYKIDYIDEDEERGTWTFDGRMVVYKLSGGKR